MSRENLLYQPDMGNVEYVISSIMSVEPQKSSYYKKDEFKVDIDTNLNSTIESKFNGDIADGLRSIEAVITLPEVNFQDGYVGRWTENLFSKIVKSFAFYKDDVLIQELPSAYYSFMRELNCLTKTRDLVYNKLEAFKADPPSDKIPSRTLVVELPFFFSRCVENYFQLYRCSNSVFKIRINFESTWDGLIEVFEQGKLNYEDISSEGAIVQDLPEVFEIEQQTSEIFDYFTLNVFCDIPEFIKSQGLDKKIERIEKCYLSDVPGKELKLTEENREFHTIIWMAEKGTVSKSSLYKGKQVHFTASSDISTTKWLNSFRCCPQLESQEIHGWTNCVYYNENGPRPEIKVEANTLFSVDKNKPKNVKVMIIHDQIFSWEDTHLIKRY